MLEVTSRSVHSNILLKAGAGLTLARGLCN